MNQLHQGPRLASCASLFIFTQVLEYNKSTNNGKGQATSGKDSIS